VRVDVFVLGTPIRYCTLFISIIEKNDEVFVLFAGLPIMRDFDILSKDEVDINLNISRIQLQINRILYRTHIPALYIFQLRNIDLLEQGWLDFPARFNYHNVHETGLDLMAPAVVHFWAGCFCTNTPLPFL